MADQLHIAHRDEYLRGRRQGSDDAQAGRDYQPRDAATGTADQQRAYRQGYADGWDEGNPCSNGTCDHPAHRQPAPAPAAMTDHEIRETIRQMLADWDAATPAQRASALAAAETAAAEAAARKGQP